MARECCGLNMAADSKGLNSVRVSMEATRVEGDEEQLVGWKKAINL